MLVVLALCLTAAWALQGGPAQRVVEPRVTESTVLPALPERALRRARGHARIVLRDVKFTIAATGARVTVPAVEISPEIPNLNRPISEVRVESIRIHGLRAIAPIDTVDTPLDAFTPIPGPRLRIGRAQLLDAEIGELADPRLGYGRWFYHVQDFDLELRDIDVAGRRTGPERLQMARLDFTGEAKGESLRVTRGTATIARTPARFDLELGTSLGFTTLALQTQFTPADDFTLQFRADTISFAELRGMASALPGHGTGKLDLSASRSGDTASVLFRHASAQIGASHAALSGHVLTGERGRVNNLALTLTNVRPEDVKRAFDFDLPGTGPYNGGIAADGEFNAGVRVNGDVRGGSPAAPSQVALNGTVRMANDEPVIDLRLTGNPFRIADTAFAFSLHALGPVDTLNIRGEVRLRPESSASMALDGGAQSEQLERMHDAAATIDLRLLDPPGAAPRRLTGHALLRATGESADVVRARADGTVTFARQPTIDARITADSLPLAVLPWPADIDSVSGFARADFRVTGEARQPSLNGGAQISRGRFYSNTARLAVSDIEGPIRLQDQRAVLSGLTARVRDGTLRIDGTAIVRGENRRVDVTLRADSVKLTPRAPLYTTHGLVNVNGAFDAPVAEGILQVTDVAHRRISATAKGRAVLAKGGALHADVLADSLPLDGLPLPTGQVDNVTGFLRGSMALRGTIEDPDFTGSLRLVDAGARILASGTRLDGLRGDLDITNERIRTEGIRGSAGAGTVTVSGSAGLTGDHLLDLRVRADSAQLTDLDSVRIVASAMLAVTGPLALPNVNGRVRLVGGWAKEDLMKKDPVIDPDDPPHAELAARVPWIRNSRILRAHQGKDDVPPFRGRIIVSVTPGIKMIDEDSELYGTGEIVVTADSNGIETSGGVRFTGGYYTNFGERFLVRGGGFRFSQTGDPILQLRAEHDLNKLGGNDLGTNSPLDWYPSLEIFALGTTATAVEQLRRLSLLPETQSQLGALLIYRQPPDPITGWYNARFWLPDKPSDFIGKRAEQQGGSLLWSYTADEAYDYLPLGRAYLRAATVNIGSRFPGRIVQGPVFQFSLNVSRKLDLTASLATEGSAAPGLRVRWFTNGLSVLTFHEPKFFAAAPAGDGRPGYTYRTRTGIGLRWEKEY